MDDICQCYKTEKICQKCKLDYFIRSYNKVINSFIILIDLYQEFENLDLVKSRECLIGMIAADISLTNLARDVVDFYDCDIQGMKLLADIFGWKIHIDNATTKFLDFEGLKFQFAAIIMKELSFFQMREPANGISSFKSQEFIMGMINIGLRLNKLNQILLTFYYWHPECIGLLRSTFLIEYVIECKVANLSRFEGIKLLRFAILTVDIPFVRMWASTDVIRKTQILPMVLKHICVRLNNLLIMVSMFHRDHPECAEFVQIVYDTISNVQNCKIF